MKKTIWILLLITLCISCASYKVHEKKKWNYSLFLSKLNSKADLINKWGSPSEKKSLEFDGLKVDVYRYINKKDHNVADFFINPSNKNIVEKVYFPRPGEEVFSIKKLKNKYFSKIIFEKIPVKCRHHNEILLINREKGLFFSTEEEKDASVYKIVFSTKKRIESSLKKMVSKKCRYR